MLTVFAVLILGWFLAATLGTWAYFAAHPKDDRLNLPSFISSR